MIPVKLKLTNFMCYRDNVPALDMENIHVACLCGDNGSGKSAIFDAITWALWGKARTNRDEDLIYLGQDDMEIELEFMHNSNRYRILRKHSRSHSSRPGTGILELQILDNGNFRSLSDQSRTETQQRIIRLLHLDYTTFINSAMLLQGKSNEFSIKAPGERKKILASILDLSFYEELKEQAKSMADRESLEVATIDREITNLNQMISEKPGYQQSLTTAINELSIVENNKNSLLDETISLRLQKEALTIKREQLLSVQKQHSERKQELATVENRLSNLNKNISHYNSIITTKEAINRGYAEFMDFSKQDGDLNQHLKQYSALIERRAKLEQHINSASNLYNSERKLLLSQIGELEKKNADISMLQTEKDSLTQQILQLDQEESAIEVNKKKLIEVNSTISSLNTQKHRLSTDIEDIKQKLSLISHSGATCPLCETELGPNEHSKIESKLQLELIEKTQQLKDTSHLITISSTSYSTLDRDIRQKENYLKNTSSRFQEKITIVQKNLEESIHARTELAQKKAKLHQLDTDIAERNFAKSEQADLEQVKSSLKSLDYDRNKHDLIQQQKISLQKYEALMQELLQAEIKLDAEKMALSESDTEAIRIKTILQELNDRISSLEREVEKLSGINDRLKDTENKHKAAVETENLIREKVTKLKEKIKQIDLFEAEKQNKETQLKSSTEDHSIYSDLTEIFSKKGIQAVLIEESIPQIESEANIILEKITDNRMSLKLESQRSTKKGDMMETLDIKIADELGTRNYEMFSGGEAFKIDIALRIAISRLLVKRTGAALPILIIDEGFGTQDSTGLEKMVEAINLIQDEFERIFVVTHLEELKDKFPVLININKTPDGSIVSLI